MTYRNRYKFRYILTIAILLAAWIAGEDAMAQGVQIHGNVFGGGNLADVKTNTEVNISAKYNTTTAKWESVSLVNGVTIDGNVYGGGKGTGDNSFTCEKAMVGVDGAGLTDNNGGTTVRIGNGTVGTLEGPEGSQTLKTGTGNVYGGGKVGRVEKNTVVMIGIEGDDNSNPVIKGDVFGAGEGLATHGYSALVRGNSSVTVQGAAEVKKSVYGGGEIATVGRYIVVDGYPTEPNGGGICTVIIKDKADISGNVVGAGKGVTPSDYSSSQHVIPSGTSGTLVGFNSSLEYQTFLETLALASETQVTIGGTIAGKTAVVRGNVYGGSESGFLQRHTQVTILDNCQIGTTSAGGNVYGGGKGLEDFADAGRVSGYTKVLIMGGTTYGSVYGGGERGYIKGGANVNMTGGTVGTIENGTLKEETGDVYGGGALADTNIGNGNEYIAVPGIATGASVTGLYEKKYKTTGDAAAINGKTYYELKSGLYVVKNGIATGASVTGLYELVIKPTSDATAALGKTYYEYKTDPGIYVVKNGLTAGQTITNLYEIDYGVTSDAAAVAGKSYYTLTHPTNVNLLGGTIRGDAYGGGLGSSTIAAMVYGDTKVNLNGMTKSEYTSLNSSLSSSLQTLLSSMLTQIDGNKDEDLNDDEDYYVVNRTTASQGCIVDEIFGCNNLNGSPKGDVTVHVYGTRHPSKTTIGDKFNPPYYERDKSPNESAKEYLGRLLNVAKPEGESTPIAGVNSEVFTAAQTTYNNEEATSADFTTVATNLLNQLDGLYDVHAVYGGGNQAAYEPTTPYDASHTSGSKSQVIIEGCDYSSIQYVYGGGNAAPTPETNLLIKGCKMIDYLFGGGNGTVVAANVGYKKDNSTQQGTGNVKMQLRGGKIHNLFGGSNSNGLIRGSITRQTLSTTEMPDDGGCCPTMQINKMYTTGKNADILGDVNDILGCMSGDWIDEYYGGAENANVKGNIDLTITSGRFRKVFGGNKTSGAIFGHIRLNIEETGDCETPIIIDELYGCGNEAPYSIYGYYVVTKNGSGAEGDGSPDAEGYSPVLTSNNKLTFRPRTSPGDSHKPVKSYDGTDNTWTVYTEEYDETNEKWIWKWTDSDNHTNTIDAFYGQPELNIIAATRIGQVYGGGYGSNAIVYGSPTVNINMIKGAWAGKTYDGGTIRNGLGEIGKDYVDMNGNTAEGGVFGGGNAAPVYGNTTVNIGSETKVYLNSEPIHLGNGNYREITDNNDPHNGKFEATVQGAYITSNVYGGGNLADVGEYDEVWDAENERWNYDVTTAGNTSVNIGAELNNSGAWGSVSEGSEGVLIVGNVYGGGNGSDETFECKEAMVLGDLGLSQGGGTNVRIGNGTVRYTADANGNTLTGNVYGGGRIARVENNTAVTIGFGTGVAGTPTTNKPVIEGSVYGAGAGLKTHGYSALVRGHSAVTIEGNAKVLQCVYGGGELATVGRYQVTGGIAEYNISGGECTVAIGGYAEIGPDDMVMKKTTGGPDDYGHVFGAGKGVLPYDGYDDETAPWSKLPNTNATYTAYKDLAVNAEDADYIKYIKTLALATSTNVTIKGYAFVKGSVYGGSENGFVQEDTHVTIQDHCQIGNGYVQMKDDGAYLTSGMRGVNRRYTTAEWDAGHLFVDGDTEVDASSEAETALRTAVSTNYTASLPECASWPYARAANAADKYAPYDKFALNTGYYSATETEANSAKGGRPVGDDGHTFYGNVFGGGSGYYPYRPGKWFESAGAVYGNTYVTINGGHILTSVYGGNEMTDVGKYDDNDQLSLTSGGNCYVTMIKGTIGVPRTLKQIENHPVTCYLFGAGKGDQRVFFNKSTNVGNVYIHISNEARIYGSVLGGGEDGHVLRNVTLNIGSSTLPAVYSNTSTDPVLKALNLTAPGTKSVTTSEEGTIIYPYIGTWGTSYVDGNVFGGGRGFAGDAYTAGNVAGTVTLNILGGTMLGSVYGGGRLGSVGYGLFDEGVTGYGVMQDDNKIESYDGDINNLADFPRGYVYLTIGDDNGNGPTIGNTYEYVNVPTDITESGLAAWKTEHHVPNTEYETTKETVEDTSTDLSTTQTLYHHRLKHTKGGNVFAGGMGRLKKLDNTSDIDAVDWWKLGCVKSTTLTIKGGTIKSNVYGGGELGQVVKNHKVKDSQGNIVYTDANQTIAKVTGTEIIIQGSNTVIGSEVKDASNNTLYTFGSVFGGGYGSLVDKVTVNGVTSYPKFIAGLVKEDTKIDMQNGAVKASIYGGGEMASVGESTTSGQTTTATGSTNVSVSGGTVGIEPITIGSTKHYFGGAKMGNVYGGGSGHYNTVRSGKIFKNTNVTISDGTIYHNVYGGGAYGTVGEFKYTEDTNNNNKVIGVESLKASGSGVATVTITGGTIGYDGRDNGMVFGSSRGDINEPGARDDYTAWVYDANVNIGVAGTSASSATGPAIKGSVYGSGENGHTFNNTVVTLDGGTIGVASDAAYPYRGNVYGGGCGTDKYYSEPEDVDDPRDGNGDRFNPLAGIVYGTTTVNINDGTVVRNVYGAGAMGSVGRIVTTTENNTTTTTITGGTTAINVSGGTIGVDGTHGEGNVFGAARGDVDATITESALVRKSTSVSVEGGTIKGNVYGGGELGCVGTFAITDNMRTFTWKNTDYANNTAANSDGKNTGICNVTVDGTSAVINGHVYGAGKGKEDTFWCEKGIAYSTNVNISNGTVNCNVYGGGEVGRVETDSQVKIGLAPEEGEGNSEPTVNGSVFGGGAGVETHGYSALVRGNTTVTVDEYAHVAHSVYGGGQIASVGRYGLDEHDMPSILQGGGYCYVTVKGHATIGEDVFGAGKGVTPAYRYAESDSYDDRMNNSKRMVPYSPYDEETEKGHKDADEEETWDYFEQYPTGYSGIKFVWEYFKEPSDYPTYLETLALATHPEVTIAGNAAISGSVFGGGELGLTKGSVIVNIQGGTIAEDVYGGGSLANTNTTDKADLNNDGNLEDVDPTTTVNLKGGTIGNGIVGGNVYGGGLGRLAKEAVEAQPAVLYVDVNEYNTAKGTELTEEQFVALSAAEKTKTPAVEAQAAVTAVAAKVYGDVLVKLNEPTTSGETTTYGDCVVKGSIFGCNNLNGSPQSDVTVHIYKTVGYGEGHQKKSKVVDGKTVPDKDNTSFDLKAVYGGGNLAAYYPDDETARASAVANVIIDGCDLTSIGSVYGGGNAASTPATEVTVNGTYEIGEVFGGGNGKDSYQIDDKTYENPGANVGYQSYAYHITEGETNYSVETHGSGTIADPYKAIEYTSSDGGDKDASTKAKRETNYAYGMGKTQVSIYGGTVHAVYGGSNSKGNVREASVALLDGEAVDESDDTYCPFDVDEAYGGGKNADMDGTATLIVSCIQGLSEVYGGAKDADVNSDVNLTITNGTYGQVFGGNNVGGRISGSISVNIEETGCRPVIIGELYGGGNKACYSVYGYKDSGNTDESGKTIWLPFESKDDASVTVNGVTYSPLSEGSKYGNPEVNVHSFTSIGTIYGGGLGTTATMVGSPTVNVNVYEGRYFEQYKGKDNVIGDNARVVGAKVETNGTNGFPIPSHARGAIGAINTIFGGGNAAEVIGNTTVNIGTETGEEVEDYMVVTVAANSDVTGYYIYSPATYTQATGTAQAGIAYYEKNGDVYTEVSVEEGDDVKDYYTLNTAAGYYHPEGTAQNGVTYYQKKTVKGADIRGNVYGGGNNAKVTGNTNVVIGKESATTP